MAQSRVAGGSGEHDATREARGVARSEYRRGRIGQPLAVHGEFIDGELRVRARVGAVDGSRILEVETQGSPEGAAEMGLALAEQLLADGAGELLAQV